MTARHSATGRSRLASVGPAHGGPLVEFLAARAIPGMESADGSRFRRHLPGGWIELVPAEDPGADWLDVGYRLEPATEVEGVLAHLRRVADLDTDLEPVARHLGRDPELAARIAAVGMARLPGTFDPFELAVRAVVGQQVTVAAARTLLGRLVALAGSTGPSTTNRSATPTGGESSPPGAGVASFPTPAAVAACDLAELGMPGSRRATIRALAQAVAEGDVELDPGADPERLTSQLLALPGIGPWTAGYITMRAVPDPDGWPRGDLVLRRSLGVGGAELERRSERWRPWRAYAALLLWRSAPSPTRRRPPTGQGA